MRASAVLLLLVAFAAAAVLGQVVPGSEENYTPAIMTAPAAGLKKPIIFAPPPVEGTADADAPLVGKAPTNLVKSAVSENIYGGVVEFVKGRTAGGCKCRKQLPEKFRYDVQYREKRVKRNKCGCPVPPPKPEDKLPPVVARLYAEPKNHTFNATRNCTRGVVPPPVTKIAPAYYPPRPKRLAKKPCAKKPQPPKPTTIAPEFYPTRSERRARRKARKAAKAAAAKKTL